VVSDAGSGEAHAPKADMAVAEPAEGTRGEPLPAELFSQAQEAAPMLPSPLSTRDAGTQLSHPLSPQIHLFGQFMRPWDQDVDKLTRWLVLSLYVGQHHGASFALPAIEVVKVYTPLKAHPPK